MNAFEHTTLTCTRMATNVLHTRTSLFGQLGTDTPPRNLPSNHNCTSLRFTTPLIHAPTHAHTSPILQHTDTFSSLHFTHFSSSHKPTAAYVVGGKNGWAERTKPQIAWDTGDFHDMMPPPCEEPSRELVSGYHMCHTANPPHSRFSCLAAGSFKHTTAIRSLCSFTGSLAAEAILPQHCTQTRRRHSANSHHVHIP